jgi:hypothetical protein
MIAVHTLQGMRRVILFSKQREDTLIALASCQNAPTRQTEHDGQGLPPAPLWCGAG